VELLIHRDATVATPAPVSPASRSAAPGVSSTAAKWVEFKALRPVVERLDARVRAGEIDAPEVLALLDQARACKPTSWGSVLGKWRQAVALAQKVA
jgi:hypothetical protein